MLGFDGDVRSIIKTCDVSNASIMKGEIKTKWRSKSDKSGNLKKKMAVKGAESQPPYQVPFTKHDVTSRASKNRKCFFSPPSIFQDYILFLFSSLLFTHLSKYIDSISGKLQQRNFVACNGNRYIRCNFIYYKYFLLRKSKIK